MRFERKVISLSLDVNLYNKLENISKKKKKTIQEIIRSIVEGYLEIRELNDGRSKRKDSDSQ
jgi:metal-responsive CopG/Arc/MetJ family transcriptional regulator